jgi:hypothetical protein
MEQGMPEKLNLHTYLHSFTILKCKSPFVR